MSEALQPSGQGPSGSQPRLGELLVETGRLSQEDLTKVLEQQRATGQPLGRLLVEGGYVPEHAIAMALANQHGGPLKTEYGFAVGTPSADGPAQPAAPPLGVSAPLLRLAPSNEAPPLLTASAVVESVFEEQLLPPVATPVVEQQIRLPDPLPPAADPVAVELPQPAAPEPAVVPQPVVAAEPVVAPEPDVDIQFFAPAEPVTTAEPAVAVQPLAPAEPVALQQPEPLDESQRALELADEALSETRAALTESELAREQAERAASDLRAQLEDAQVKEDADRAARSALETELATVREQLAAAEAVPQADGNELTNEELRNAVRKNSELDATLASTREQLDAAVADAAGARAQLASELAARDSLQQAVAELTAHVTKLSERLELLSSAPTPSVAPATHDELVVQQEDPEPEARRYSIERHLLFAPGPEAYELVERKGPPPARDSIVQMSGGRMFRVARLGPAPVPGAAEACAFLEPIA